MTVLREIGLIFWRQLRHSMRSPVWVLFGISQPVTYLVLYGPIMTRVLRDSGTPADEVWQMYVPGVLVQLGLFGAAFAGFTLIADVRFGVVDRMRVTPVSRLALLLGRVLRDVVVLVAQATILLAVAVPFGLRPSPLGTVAGLALFATLALSLASLSYAVSLMVKSEEAMTPLLNTILLPLLLLSGILIPMSLGPRWLDTVSQATPIRYVVDAIRQAFLGHVTAPETLRGAAVTLVIAVLSIGLGVRSFVRQSA